MNIRQCVAVGATTVAALAVAACDALISKPSLYGTVSAEVRRRDSTAVPGARVLLYTGQRPIGYAVTDDNGAFTFLHVPDGLYGVRVVPPAGYLSINDIIGGPDSSVVRDGLVLLPGENKSVRFRLFKDGPGNVNVYVEDADRKAMPGIRVVLYSSRGSVQEGVTDQTGLFQFAAVPLGNYGVFALRPAAYTDSAENPLPSRDGFVVDQGSVSTATFQFARCVGSLNVRVRDNTGAPVPGTLLTFYGAFGVQDSILGAQAERHIADLACGPYGVRIRPPIGWIANEARGSAFQDNISIHRGTAANVTLNILRIGRGTVRVRVLDDLGAPIENIRTVLYTGQGLLRDVLTGPDGYVSMADLLVNSEYGVRVVPRAGFSAAEAVGSTYYDGIKLINGETRDFVFRFKRD